MSTSRIKERNQFQELKILRTVPADGSYRRKDISFSTQFAQLSPSPHFFSGAFNQILL